MDRNKKLELEKFAADIRIGILDQLGAFGVGHIGGSLSIADALAVLYGDVMKYDPANPTDPNRDKLVMSKGHCGPALYSALALKGFFPYEMLKTLNQGGTHLPSHCDRLKTPGVDMTTGSLGQGSSIALGMARGDKLKGRSCRTFLICGDGEINEGQFWEMCMFAGSKKVDNLVIMVDYNRKQLDGTTEEIMDLGDLAAKLTAFGLDTKNIDGNDIEQLYNSLKETGKNGKPTALVLNTLKGKGIADVENTYANHSMTVTKELYEKWTAEVKSHIAGLEE